MSTTPPDAMFHRLCKMAALLIPLLAGIFTATSEVYWLDSPEFTAAAQTLGIPHPPGHPLYIMFTRAFTLLPIGTIAFRVALASATCSALAGFFLFNSAHLLYSKISDRVPDWQHTLLALVTTLIATLSYGWWFQAVRQEVYALQIMLITAALWPVIKSLFATNQVDIGKNLLAAAFIFGLGLTNHHFIMLVALPAAIPAIIAIWQRINHHQRWPLVIKMAGLVLFGLAPYLFIPIRSAHNTGISLGAVHTFSDFFWVVSAQVYQKSLTRQTGFILNDAPMDAIFSIMTSLGPVVVVSAAGGLYLLLRRRSTRAAGAVLATLGGVSLLLRALMGFDPYNPDYYGYILGTVAAISLLFGALVTTVLHVLHHSLGKPGIPALLLLLTLAAPIQVARRSAPKVDLSDFNATRIVYDTATKDIPGGAVAITSYYKLFFLMWSQQFVDGSRPDITVVNPLFFGYPGYLAQITTQTPILKALAWSTFVKGTISENTIAKLTDHAPLYLDPVPWNGEIVNKHLLPAPVLYNARTEPVSTTDVMNAGDLQQAGWRRFYHRIGTNWKEHETWRFLVWNHYLDAVYQARSGARNQAQKAIDFSHAIGAATTELNQLEDLLRQGTGPVDVSTITHNPFKQHRRKDKNESKK